MTNLSQQVEDLDNKITVALFQTCEVFRVRLRDKAKDRGYGPLQLQILLTLLRENGSLTSSILAHKLNITKQTLSDAIKPLLAEELIQKQDNPEDSRSFLLVLSEFGEKEALKAASFAEGIQSIIETLNPRKKGAFLETLLEIIYKLQKAGFISLNKMCFSCQYYQLNVSEHYCSLLGKSLEAHELRIHCPEHEGVT
jgi:DNA-binding MarR family transcriptional regulator